MKAKNPQIIDVSDGNIESSRRAESERSMNSSNAGNLFGATPERHHKKTNRALLKSQHTIDSKFTEMKSGVPVIIDIDGPKKKHDEENQDEVASDDESENQDTGVVPEWQDLLKITHQP